MDLYDRNQLCDNDFVSVSYFAGKSGNIELVNYMLNIIDKYYPDYCRTVSYHMFNGALIRGTSSP